HKRCWRERRRLISTKFSVFNVRDFMFSSAPGQPDARSPGAPDTGARRLLRTIALVGLMGAGKSAIGRRLAQALQAPVAGSELIAAAAGMSIPDIFERYGEAEFRDLERRVVGRVLDGSPVVLALGGGAFIDPQVRGRVRQRALSIWLRADLDTLVNRTSRKRA